MERMDTASNRAIHAVSMRAVSPVCPRPRCAPLPCQGRAPLRRASCTAREDPCPGTSCQRVPRSCAVCRTTIARPSSPCLLDSQNMATLLHPGRLSPTRQVPVNIPRPEYVGKKNPTLGEPDVKDADTIARMRVAGRLAAQALEEVGRHVRPGVTTDELDAVGHEFLVARGAYPSTLGYRGYPKSLCTSLNEVICHGIPDDTLVNDGDIVNIDITAFIGGVHGDTNATFCAGNVDEESRLLVERTYEAMMRGVRAVAAGRALNVVGRVIESYARRFGYGVVRDFIVHGICTAFHSGLVLPHSEDP